MHRTPSRRRSAARLLSLAAAAGLGAFYNTAPDPANPPAGGGGGSPAPKAPENQPKKLELTEEELEAKINARLDAERKKAEDKAKRDKEEADRKKAEEEGKFKELADAAEEKAAAAEARALAAERATLIDDAFIEVASAENGPSLKSLREWVKPKVLAGLAPDAAPEDVTKAAKQLAEQYAKDNPRQAKGSAGAPPAPRGGNVRPGATPEPKPQQQNNRPRFAGLNFRG